MYPSATAMALMIVLAVRHGVEHLVLRTPPGGKASGRWQTVLLAFGYTAAAGGALAYVWAQDPERDALAAAGWALLGLGAALRFWARQTLGHFFSYHTVIRDDHRLIDSGPYALCRHPLSVGMLMEAAGCALVGGAWPLAVPCALLAGAFALRNPREERCLAESLGEPYRRYRSAVPAMNLLWGLLRFGLRRGLATWRDEK